MILLISPELYIAPPPSPAAKLLIKLAFILPIDPKEPLYIAPPSPAKLRKKLPLIAVIVLVPCPALLSLLYIAPPSPEELLL